MDQGLAAAATNHQQDRDTTNRTLQLILLQLQHGKAPTPEPVNPNIKIEHKPHPEEITNVTAAPLTAADGTGTDPDASPPPYGPSGNDAAWTPPDDLTKGSGKGKDEAIRIAPY